jgi:hypothetical protein
LALQGIAEGVIAEGANAFGQGPAAALGLDLQQLGGRRRSPQCVDPFLATALQALVTQRG